MGRTSLRLGGIVTYTPYVFPVVPFVKLTDDVTRVSSQHGGIGPGSEVTVSYVNKHGGGVNGLTLSRTPNQYADNPINMHVT